MRRLTATFVCVGAVVLAACADDDDTADTSATSTTAVESVTTAPATSAPGPASTAAPSTPPTTAATESTAPATPPPASAPATQPPTTAPPPVFGDPAVAAELVVELEQPIGMAVRPGDPNLYVIEQEGLVVQVAPAGDTSATVADVRDRTDAGGERGLLGLAFALDGARAWLNYTDNNGDTVVAEYPVAPDGTFDVAAERVLLTIEQPYSNHNGGDLLTGPDGTLYIATGDGGAGGDPERRASDPTNRLGKLLRIDPNPSGEAPYSIPPDNPFASGAMGDVEAALEVWSLGLRNPWKIALDPVTGDLWIADVGQNSIEEVNVVAPAEGHPAGWGANFGWSAFEGNARYNEDVPDPGTLVFPVWTYGHDQGCSISGGAVYRGAAIAELAPAYVYSDYCSGVIWAFDVASGRNEVLLDGFSNVAAVRTGPDGELYVIEQNGRVSRLVQG